MIFVFGSPRSGSTWLAKLFDSHPDLLYLHEPDIPDRGTDVLPYWFDATPTNREVENARLYLRRLAARRDVRTVGIRPFFSKSYRGAAAEAGRRALIYAAKALERVRLSAIVDRLHVPDLASGTCSPRLVIKSVVALGRAEAFLAADGSIAPVLLIRHPCGYVRSVLQGRAMGIMSPVQRLGRLAATRSAERLGVHSGTLGDADEVTLLAWSWLIANAEAIPVIERAHGTILVYEEIASDPAHHIPRLFERLALGWPQQTRDFLERSQASQGDFYSVFRNSRDTVDRWRTELDQATIGKIRKIVERHPAGARFF